MTLAEKHSLTYPVLSDRANAIARSFGIVFTVDEGMRTILQGFGVHLPAYNGDSTYELPVPATISSPATRRSWAPGLTSTIVDAANPPPFLRGCVSSWARYDIADPSTLTRDEHFVELDHGLMSV